MSCTRQVKKMRKLTVERRKGEAEESRISDTCRVGLDRRTVSGTQKPLKVKLDLQEKQNGGTLRCSGSVWAGELKGTKVL